MNRLGEIEFVEKICADIIEPIKPNIDGILEDTRFFNRFKISLKKSVS